MKKDKIEFGQCYEYKDHIYMVIHRKGDKHWMVQDTLTKEIRVIDSDTLRTWRRPFTNWG